MKIEDILNQVLQNPNSAFFYTPPFYKKSYSYLFLKPKNEIIVNNQNELKKLKLIDNLLNKGLNSYTLIKYEAGYLFEDQFKKYLRKSDKKLLQFYFFDGKNFKKIASNKIEIGDINKNYQIKNFKLNTSKKKFLNDIRSIKKFIAAGDTYQVNYTVKGNFKLIGDPINLFKNLMFNQSAKYSAFINSGNDLIISLSPELFFLIEKNKIFAKPMKGTLHRGKNIHEDLLLKYSLSISKKDQAENIMIVDLLRNDIGKISQFGKVKTKNLFQIETYETLHQMTSTIQGTLRQKINFENIIKSLFPCGSITGAPKIRTMEIINHLESDKRGIYTGAAGILNKDKKILNVAIRTIKLNKKTGNGEMGLGSGIVWDSSPEAEYNETLLKSNFLLKPLPYFELFETMKVENGKIFLLDDHLERLENTANYFLFNFDKNKILKIIKNEIEKIDVNLIYRLRLKLNKWGQINIMIYEYPYSINYIKIILSEKIISSKNKFQYFKTTNRKLYDEELLKYYKKGFSDVIFLNENNEIAEGAITNIFIVKDKTWFTPPLSSGILNGVYRKYLLQNNVNIKEEKIYLNDLLNCDQIILTNSLRGEVKVEKIYFNEKEFRKFNF